MLTNGDDVPITKPREVLLLEPEPLPLVLKDCDFHTRNLSLADAMVLLSDVVAPASRGKSLRRTDT